MKTAKHAFRGAMKALQELGLGPDASVKTVDEVAAEIQTGQSTGLVSSVSEQPFIGPKVSFTDGKTDHLFNAMQVKEVTETVIEMDPTKIVNWIYHDRIEQDCGDVQSLAEDLKRQGQIQPCIIRPQKDSKDNYELIVGERRWKAAKLAGINLKVIVKNLNDNQVALRQISENNQRQNISDYAKGMNYAKLIKDKILSVHDLEVCLNMSKSAIDRLLSFNKIPNEIWAVVGDPTKITARLAAEMRALLNKGDQYKDAILMLGPKFRANVITTRNIKSEVENLVHKVLKNTNYAKEVKSYNGRHLFTWRKDNNKNISISFPKDIRQHLDREKLIQVIMDEIE